jgi:hypothetical protein
MPPPTSQDLAKLVRELGLHTQPGTQRQALASLMRLMVDAESAVANAAAGAIPLLVQLLRPE